MGLKMVYATSNPESLNLLLPPSLKLKISHEDFIKLALVNRNLRLERSAEGELIVNPPTGWETGQQNAKMTYQLVKWIEELGGSGIAFDSSTGFTLPNGAERSPDASWVSQERWNALSPKQKQTFADICPDFVIELRSASDSLKILQKKMQEYLDNGTKLGWLIDPQNRRAEIYRQGREVEVLINPQTLSGEDVLPGFSLNLQRIWER
jgi:Uma2 family endonuclease